MSVVTIARKASFDEVVAEMDRRGAVIEMLERQIAASAAERKPRPRIAKNVLDLLRLTAEAEREVGDNRVAVALDLLLEWHDAD